MSAASSASYASETAESGGGLRDAPRLPSGAGTLDYVAWEPRARAFLTVKGVSGDLLDSPIAGGAATFLQLQARVAASAAVERDALLALALQGASAIKDEADGSASSAHAAPHPEKAALEYARQFLSHSQRAYGLLFAVLPEDLASVAAKDDAVVAGYAHSLWAWLTSRFRRTAVDTIPDLWLELVALQKGAEQWGDYKAKVDDVRRRIERAGDAVSDGFYCAKLLHQLPSGYLPATTALTQSGKLSDHKKIDWHAVREAIETHERQMGRNASASSSSGDSATAMAFTQRSSSGCHACGEQGHYAADCPNEAARMRHRGGASGSGRGRNAFNRGGRGRGPPRSREGVPGGADSAYAVVTEDDCEREGYTGRETLFMSASSELAFAAADVDSDRSAPLRRLRRPGEAAVSQGKGGQQSSAPAPNTNTGERPTSSSSAPPPPKSSPAARVPPAGGKAAPTPPRSRSISFPDVGEKLKAASAAKGELGPKLGTVLSNLKKSWWGVDSMASVHVTGNRKNLFNVRRCAPLRISIADGREIPITECGTLRMRVAARGRERGVELTLYEVYYHPAVTANLLSVGKLKRCMNMEFLFKAGNNVMVTPDDVQIPLLSIGDVHILKPGGTEIVASAVEPVCGLVCAVGSIRAGERVITTLKDLIELHLTLGHVSLDAILKACGCDKVDGLGAVRASKETLKRAQILISECPTCALARGKSTPLSNVGLDRGNAAGEVLHMDTFFVPLTDAATGNKWTEYGLVLKDGYDGSLFFRRLTRKSETADAVVDTLKQICTARGKTVKRLHTDKGSEFINDKVLGYCRGAGIELQYSPPGRKELNGIAERAVQEIKGLTRAYMLHCKLPVHLWYRAALYAVHVWNRTRVHLRTGVTPFESYYGRRPDVSYLAPFGCDAFVHVPPEKRVGDAFADRVQAAVYLGHDPAANCPLLLRLADGRLVSSRDVVFREGSFMHAASLDTAPRDPARERMQHAWRQMAAEDDTPFSDAFDFDGYDASIAARSTDSVELPADVPSVKLPLQPSVREVETDDDPSTKEWGVRGIAGRITSPVRRVLRSGAARGPCRTSNTLYLVEWEGKYEPTWEPYSNLRGSADEIVDEFDKKVAAGELHLGEDGVAVSPTEAEASAVTDESEDEQHPADAAVAVVMGVVCDAQAPHPEEKGRAAALEADAAGVRPESAEAPMERALAALELTDLLSDNNAPTYAEAIRGPDGKLWQAAADKEINSCLASDTWTEVERSALPPGANVISCKFVCKRKTNEKGEITELKARLTPRGYEQMRGVDFHDVFAPTGRYRSMRVQMFLAARFRMQTEQLDVPSAFLNAELKEEVYMEMPPGYGTRNTVLRLNKALYGLKQAPREWYLLISAFLRDTCGLTPLVSDPCVFYKRTAAGRLLLVFLFVDDMQGAFDERDRAEWAAVKAHLSERFKVKDLGPTKWFLGMQVTRGADGSIKIDQSKYIDDMARRFGLGDGSNVRTFDTPASSVAQAQEEDDRDGGGAPADRQHYMELIGSLMYAAITTRLDTTYEVCRLARFLLSPCKRHVTAAMRVLRYLVASKEQGLVYRPSDDPSKPIVIDAYSDSDYAGDHATRKSTTGWIARLDGDVVSWQSRLQRNVARSSCVAELYAGAGAMEELLYLRGLLGELGLHSEADGAASVLRMDNQSAMVVARNGVRSSERVKHVEVHFHWVTECIDQQKIDLVWVRSEEQLADILTKPLGAQPFLRLRARLMA